MHADQAHSKLFWTSELGTIKATTFPQKILRECKQTVKESGVNPLCLAQGFLVSRQGETVLRSPIILTPLGIREDKVREQISFEAHTDQSFLNPYIEVLLDEKNVDYKTIELEELPAFLTESGFEVDSENLDCIGNFHHHRYSVLQEIELLMESNQWSIPLKALFGELDASVQFPKLPEGCLFPADRDHVGVFNAIPENLVVIQGPPGTGKSQVLTNIAAKLLAMQKQTLVLSEKHVALSVILQKLRVFQLDRLGYIATSDSDVHQLLTELQDNWNFFEQSTIDLPSAPQLSGLYENQLQFSLDVLNQPDAIGGISLYEFKQHVEKLDLNPRHFVSDPPSISDFLSNETQLQKIYETGISHQVGMLKQSTIRDEAFHELDQKIRAWLEDLTRIQQLLPFETLADFLDLMKQASICQILENDLYKKYSALYEPNSKAQKKFFRLQKRYLRISKELEALENEPSDWIKTPSLEGCEMLRSLSKSKSFAARIKLKRQWKIYSRLPVSEMTNALEKHSEYLEKNKLKTQITLDFCDLGIENPEMELAIIQASILQLGEEQWTQLAQIPLDKRAKITQFHDRILGVYRELKQHFNVNPEAPIIAQLEALLNCFGSIVSEQNALNLLNDSMLRLLGFSSNFEVYQSTVYQSHWARFQQQFPTLSGFSMAEMHTKITEITTSESQEADRFSQQILGQVQAQFLAYHQLLNTPARKLNATEKLLKQELKKGKSILVKEFAKTRSHPSMRQLFASEARLWIQLLKPLWLSNPTQVARSFPMEEGLFDMVIFDEASQIPLQNALGALQRSKHSIVAGDSQQMGPTAYFKSGGTAVLDLLHQASFYWKGCSLQHHYRSAHPALIEFSNRHFYANSLSAFPAYGKKCPLKHHLIAEGVFDQRRNSEEAKAVAAHITAHLKPEETLGIVAFSEEQLACIWEAMGPTTQAFLVDGQERGTVFFKSLENVQGDECDHLIISFGYAKNPEGVFEMRFGPMNTANGRKRLNVLLTRAKQQLDFFSSVEASEFKLTENESVNLLRQWFLHLAKHGRDDTEVILPFDADVKINGNHLELMAPHKHLNEAREMITFQQVMESRGWKISYS